MAGEQLSIHEVDTHLFERGYLAEPLALVALGDTVEL